MAIMEAVPRVWMGPPALQEVELRTYEKMGLLLGTESWLLGGVEGMVNLGSLTWTQTAAPPGILSEYQTSAVTEMWDTLVPHGQVVALLAANLMTISIMLLFR